MSELAVAALLWRYRTHATAVPCLEEQILGAQKAGECPTGWPVYAPDEYESQLKVKADLVRRCFPEAGAVEVMPSPPAHHRMRAKVKDEHTRTLLVCCIVSPYTHFSWALARLALTTRPKTVFVTRDLNRAASPLYLLPVSRFVSSCRCCWKPFTWKPCCEKA